jgi:hypothetical protein
MEPPAASTSRFGMLGFFIAPDFFFSLEYLGQPLLIVAFSLGVWQFLRGAFGVLAATCYNAVFSLI